MSTSASEHQKSKGQGNPVPNGPKDHHGGENREELDSWRSQQHHQGYASSMGGGDPYNMPYYGSFQYQTGPAFGVSGDGGPWSTNGGDMAFVGGGYPAGVHEAGPPSGHYNNMEGGGVFGGGNGAGFGNFAGQQQPGFGYGYGNGDYNTWGPRKQYDDYYRSREGMYGDDRGMKMVDGMSGLSLSDKDHSLKELKEMMGSGGGGPKKTTWASVASQPAKPQSLLKKKTGMGGMPPPPIMLGTWEKNGSVPKAPVAAPVQAPHPPVWERMERVPKIPPPGGHPHQPPHGAMPPQLHGQGPPPGRVGLFQHPQGGPMGYNPMPPPTQQSHPQPPPPPPLLQQPHQPTNNTNHVAVPAAAAPGKASPTGPQYPDEAKMKSDYNPSHFDLTADGARFFVIKSYSEDDIHRSIKYEIWCSTEHGNKRLEQAWSEREGKGPIYLFFSVNSSGHFCGMAQMMSNVDYEASSSVWCQDKWKGQFKVKWVYVKDVPNSALRHIRLENNENKAVTNSRDTQEVPLEKGKLVLKILHTFHHSTSIFDDFIHYEKRQEEEDHRRTTAPSPPPSNNNHHHDRGERNERGHGRGGGSQSNHYSQHRDRDRDFNSRDGMNRGGGDRDGHQDRGPYQSRGGGMRGMDRDQYGGGGRDGGRGFDRGGDRDFYQRDRGGPGASGRGGRPSRN